jgi:hypothetical protein
MGKRTFYLVSAGVFNLSLSDLLGELSGKFLIFTPLL